MGFADRPKNPIVKEDSSTRDELQKALELGTGSEPSSLASSWKLEDLDDVASSLSMGDASGDDFVKAIQDIKIAAEDAEPDTKNSEQPEQKTEEKKKKKKKKKKS